MEILLNTKKPLKFVCGCLKYLLLLNKYLFNKNVATVKRNIKDKMTVENTLYYIKKQTKINRLELFMAI